MASIRSAVLRCSANSGRAGWVQVALLVAALTPVLVFTHASEASAQQGEAQALFAEANGHLARGLRSRGRRRAAELERALNGYLAVVQMGVRTRNVIFNLGLTHQELDRNTEAFNYYSEYLRTFDLNEEDRAEGQRRLDSIRPEVAVVEIVSEPDGAELRVDRRDLPVRGQTPIALALPLGEHTLFLDREGYESAEGSVTATAGESATVQLTLEASPVALQVLAPANGNLTLDGEPLTSGQSTPVPPGPHVLVLNMPGAAPVERRFEVPVGGEPMVLEMNAVGPSGTPLTLAINTPAGVYLDGARVGMGERVSLPVALGPHRLRLEADGFIPLVQSISVTEAPLELRAVLGARANNGGLNGARVTFGVATLIGGVVYAVTGLGALVANSAFEDRLAMEQDPGGADADELNGLANQVDSWSLAADITLGITAALAVTSIILFALPGDEDQPSRLEVVGAPAPGGGVVAARGTFGGAL